MSRKKTKNRGLALQPDPSNQSSNQSAPVSSRTRKATKTEPAHTVQSNLSELKPPRKPNRKSRKKAKRLYARAKKHRAQADKLELQAKTLETSVGLQGTPVAGSLSRMDTSRSNKQEARIGSVQKHPIAITEDDNDDSELDDLATNLGSVVSVSEVGVQPCFPPDARLLRDPVWGAMIAATREQAAVWLRTRYASKLPRHPTAEYIPASQFNASDLVMSGGLPAAASGRAEIDNSHLLDVETHLHIARPRKRERRHSPNLDYIRLEGEISDSEDYLEGPPVYKKHRSQYHAAEPVTNNLLWDVD
jgi:hypothetical protein